MGNRLTQRREDSLAWCVEHPRRGAREDGQIRGERVRSNQGGVEGFPQADPEGGRWTVITKLQEAIQLNSHFQLNPIFVEPHALEHRAANPPEKLLRPAQKYMPPDHTRHRRSGRPRKRGGW